LDEEHSGERPFLPTFFGYRKKVWSFGKDANRKTAWMQVRAAHNKRQAENLDGVRTNLTLLCPR
jgi:hypothetical protein